MYQIMKLSFKSEMKLIHLKFVTNGGGANGILLQPNVCPLGINCPCPEANFRVRNHEECYIR